MQAARRRWTASWRSITSPPSPSALAPAARSSMTPVASPRPAAAASGGSAPSHAPFGLAPSRSSCATARGHCAVCSVSAPSSRGGVSISTAHSASRTDAGAARSLLRALSSSLCAASSNSLLVWALGRGWGRGGEGASPVSPRLTTRGACSAAALGLPSWRGCPNHSACGAPLSRAGREQLGCACGLHVDRLGCRLGSRPSCGLGHMSRCRLARGSNSGGSLTLVTLYARIDHISADSPCASRVSPAPRSSSSSTVEPEAPRATTFRLGVGLDRGWGVGLGHIRGDGIDHRQHLVQHPRIAALGCVDSLDACRLKTVSVRVGGLHGGSQQHCTCGLALAMRISHTAPLACALRSRRTQLASAVLQATTRGTTLTLPGCGEESVRRGCSVPMALRYARGAGVPARPAARGPEAALTPRRGAARRARGGWWWHHATPRRPPTAR